MAQWRKKTVDEIYTDDEIKARLAEELPKWYYEDGWIRRKYKTSGWKGTLMVVNTVGHLAELDEGTLSGALGQGQAAHLHALAWGRDDRPVARERDRHRRHDDGPRRHRRRAAT